MAALKIHCTGLAAIIISTLLIIPFVGCQPTAEADKNAVTQAGIDQAKKEIIKMGEEDQRYSRMLDSLTTQDSKADSSADKPVTVLDFNQPLDKTRLIQLMHETDAAHAKRMSEIINIHGWPTVSEFGSEAAAYGFLIIQHASLPVQKKYFPLLENAAKNGEASLEHVAMMTDRILMRESKPQVYGTQLSRTNGIIRLYPIADEVNVDKRRRAMGMKPLNEYQQQMNAETKMPTDAKSP